MQQGRLKRCHREQRSCTQPSKRETFTKVWAFEFETALSGHFPECSCSAAVVMRLVLFFQLPYLTSRFPWLHERLREATTLLLP